MTGTATNQRVAFVTGGAGGLGRSVCRSLAEAGNHVCVVDLDEGAAGDVAAALRSDGLEVSAYGCDVTSRADVEETCARVGDSVGVVDILVNLAGVTRNAPLLKIDDDDFELVLSTHLRSTLYTMRALAPGMKQNKYGRIVNTSSIAALGSPAGGSYGSAKAGIEGLSHSAAIELARHGVTVNCIAPGLVDAGMFLKTPDSFRDPLINRIPMGRFAQPQEIAACIRFLASPECSYVTGQTLLACGGLSISALV